MNYKNLISLIGIGGWFICVTTIVNAQEKSFTEHVKFLVDYHSGGKSVDEPTGGMDATSNISEGECTYEITNKTGMPSKNLRIDYD